MSRISRNELLYPGCHAHVISRSIRKIRLFSEEEDFEKFKGLLQIAKRTGGFQIYHYCVMRTHFHLAVKMGDVSSFSDALRDLKRSYAYWFHAKHRMSGPLWRERYRSLLVENEQYLYTCGQYIENNPVKAGIVERSEQWVHSSGRHWVSGDKDDLVDAYESHVHTVMNLTFDEKEFEAGSVIGSSFFRFQFYDSRRRGVTCPRG